MKADRLDLVVFLALLAHLESVESAACAVLREVLVLRENADPQEVEACPEQMVPLAPKGKTEILDPLALLELKVESETPVPRVLPASRDFVDPRVSLDLQERRAVPVTADLPVQMANQVIKVLKVCKVFLAPWVHPELREQLVNLEKMALQETQVL